jgi:hypothetical protein
MVLATATNGLEDFGASCFEFFLRISSIHLDANSIIPSTTLYGVLNMSYPSIEIVCGKCGSVINKIMNLKSIKDVLRPTNGRCRICGNVLNPSDFTIELEKQ